MIERKSFWIMYFIETTDRRHSDFSKRGKLGKAEKKK